MRAAVSRGFSRLPDGTSNWFTSSNRFAQELLPITHQQPRRTGSRFRLRCARQRHEARLARRALRREVQDSAGASSKGVGRKSQSGTGDSVAYDRPKKLRYVFSGALPPE